MKYSPEVDDAEPVHAKCFNRRPACLSEAEYQRKISAPLEMLLPLLPARVKQRDADTIDRIKGVCLDALMAFASAAG